MHAIYTRDMTHPFICKSHNRESSRTSHVSHIHESRHICEGVIWMSRAAQTPVGKAHPWICAAWLVHLFTRHMCHKHRQYSNHTFTLNEESGRALRSTLNQSSDACQAARYPQQRRGAPWQIAHAYVWQNMWQIHPTRKARVMWRVCSQSCRMASLSCHVTSL